MIKKVKYWEELRKGQGDQEKLKKTLTASFHTLVSIGSGFDP